MPISYSHINKHWLQYLCIQMLMHLLIMHRFQVHYLFTYYGCHELIWEERGAVYIIVIL